MESRSRKIWTAIVPLAVGAAVLGSWWIVDARRNPPSSNAPVSTKAASAVGVAIPQDPAHEKVVLEEQLKRNPEHPPILMRLAELEQQAGRPARALPYLRKILERDSKNAEARLELGRSLYDSGDIDEALTETKHLLADHPENVDGMYNLGAIYANRNQFELARQTWRQAIALDPKSDSGHKAQDGLTKLGKAIPGTH